MGHEDVVFDDLAVEQMLLNNALNDSRRSAVVPNPLGIYQQNGALLTDAQAVGFGAKGAGGPLWAGGIEAQLFEALLEVVPSGEARGFVAALGFCLVGTDEDVAIDRV